jgi:hypothetical protein
MYEDNTKWINQTILMHKDNLYSSDGFLRVSISTGTHDYKNFNPPSFNISIGNQFQRSYNLNVIRASDLLTSFKNAFKGGATIFNDKTQIVKQNQTVQFIVEFTKSQNGDLVVKMTIRHSETDFTVVIVSADVFQIFANRLKYFVEKYDQICLSQYQASLQGELTEVLLQLPNLIKGMPSQILSTNYIDSRGAPEEQKVKETEATIADLDNFLGGEEMKNIEVKELEEKKEEVIQEFNSPFVENVIKGNLRNLETILSNTTGIEELSQRLKTELRWSDDISILPGITEDEMISLLYISRILENLIELGWTKFGTPVPSSTPALRYKPIYGIHPDNLALACDLMLFSGYIRTLRRRLEDKIEDCNENKALFYIRFRCFMDPFYFSYAEKFNEKNFISLILARYKYYDKIGVFDEYKNILNAHNCVSITERDIQAYVNEVIEKIVGKSRYILDFHDEFKSQNGLRIGAKSNFTKEQIINEIIPLEIAEKMGQDPPEIEVSDEVKNFFKGKTKVEKIVEKKNHLTRVIGTYINDIPERHREEFMKFIEGFAEKNFDFSGDFPYQEFGEDIIKALYVWKPEDDNQIKNSLKHYQTLIENEVMEKQYILAVGNKEVKEEPEINFDINLDL